VIEKIGKYKILRLLGTGATSEVYLALDPFTNRQVAVKVVNASALGDRETGRRYRKLFLNEASLVGKLAHPHIATIYDAAEEDDASYIVMEFVDGETLQKYCKLDNLLPIDKTIEIIFKCCRALVHAQQQGIIHRDIKPANVLLTPDGDIKITDFGAALAVSSDTTQLTGIGSPAYMSPEQVKEQPLSHQTDIFSLGVLFYYMLTGHHPFMATNNYSVVYLVNNVEPPPPSSFRAEIPVSLDRIVAKALAKKTDARYPTWEHFAGDLVGAFSTLNTQEQNIPDSERFNILRGLHFFHVFDDIELWEVLRITTWNRFTQGDILLREGEVGHSFFILVSGEVKICKGESTLGVLKAGDCFGEMAYLGSKQFHRTASAIAEADVTLIEISSEALSNASEACRHRFNGAFLEILVDRLEGANTRLSNLLAERNISIF
jgi:eukaryotic-like serine/threonine-protein kinase